jgi:hypothetical protein
MNQGKVIEIYINPFEVDMLIASNVIKHFFVDKINGKVATEIDLQS